MSVVYSFQGRWEELLRRGGVSVFFGKKRPINLPDKVFFYIGVATKSIIGFFRVKSINEVSIADAILLSGEGSITENELKNILGRTEGLTQYGSRKWTFSITHESYLI